MVRVVLKEMAQAKPICHRGTGIPENEISQPTPFGMSVILIPRFHFKLPVFYDELCVTQYLNK
jgi:hypothetical protein